MNSTAETKMVATVLAKDGGQRWALHLSEPLQDYESGHHQYVCASFVNLSGLYREPDTTEVLVFPMSGTPEANPDKWIASFEELEGTRGVAGIREALDQFGWEVIDELDN